VPPQSRPLIIPAWVPVEARQAIEALWERPFLNENDRAVLRRFATRRVMYTDVWEKLPRKPEGFAGCVIPLAIFALKTFPLQRPRPRSKKHVAWKNWARHRSEYPRQLDWQTCAGLAMNLRDVLVATSDEAWSHHWRGDPAMNRTSFALSLDALANCFQSIGAETQSFFSNLRLPPVARWDDPRAAERFFSELMSDKLEALCGRYCDPVVDALTAVAFNLPDGPGPATVRGRRRMRAAK